MGLVESFSKLDGYQDVQICPDSSPLEKVSFCQAILDRMTFELRQAQDKEVKLHILVAEVNANMEKLEQDRLALQSQILDLEKSLSCVNQEKDCLQQEKDDFCRIRMDMENQILSLETMKSELLSEKSHLVSAKEALLGEKAALISENENLIACQVLCVLKNHVCFTFSECTSTVCDSGAT
jgi:septal ring factor EnvC (AmiA/AmiB activator)